MDRSSLQRILIAVLVFAGVYFLFNKLGNKDKGPNTSFVHETYELAQSPAGPPGAPCIVETESYKATVAPVSGGLLSSVRISLRTPQLWSRWPSQPSSSKCLPSHSSQPT